MNGLPATGAIGLGRPGSRCWTRVPKPPARTTATVRRNSGLMSSDWAFNNEWTECGKPQPNDFNHGWTRMDTDFTGGNRANGGAERWWQKHLRRLRKLSGIVVQMDTDSGTRG